MKSLVLILLIALLGCTLAQINVPGPCRSLPVTTYFDATLYVGVWYQLKRYDTEIEAGLDCNTADYVLNDLGSIDVFHSGTDLQTELHSFINGRAYTSFPDEAPLRGLLNVTFTSLPANRANYQIIETDYENYSLVWDCVNNADGTSSEYAWILARAYELTGEQQARVDSLVALHLDASQLRVNVQDQEICLGGEGPAPAM